MFDTKLEDELGRLAALRRYEVLDSAREEAFDKITELVKAVLQVPVAAVTLVDSDRQWFKSCVGLDVSETARDISFCTHTIRTRMTMNIPDALADPRFALNPLVTGGPRIRSYLGVPLSTPDGYNLGALCAIDTVPRDFDLTQTRILESFAVLVMEVVELRRIAQVDHLTGAATRRAFTLEAEKAIERFKRQSNPCALVTLDVDHFKQINDTFGHPVGDLVLRQVGNTLASSIRLTDGVGRLGGEEFGILLPGIDLQVALLTAERLRRTLEELVIPHTPPVRLTASFGVAMLDRGRVTLDSWLRSADRALYTAKSQGRNRCCVDRESAAV